MTELKPFDRLESEVRGYCRDFPAIFDTARGHELHSTDGRRWIDFFSGAGVLNYGHNEPRLKQALLEYLAQDSVVHSLDMATAAKGRFLDALEEYVLKPRGLDYKVMFPGPTGTNAVEAALKLARKVTGRHNIVAFTNAFHGMTLGSLALTGNAEKRGGAGLPLDGVTRVPFEGYMPDLNALGLLERLLTDRSSGVDAPAAIVLETVQAEGGVQVASPEFLRGLRRLADHVGALLVVDDIQVGCGRTGRFFSFEESGIVPDLVPLSKSLSGLGLPLSVLLIRPELDQWAPGEHNGTFRGHNPAFVTATRALELYWADDTLTEAVLEKGRFAADRLRSMAGNLRGLGARVRGRGLILGLELPTPGLAGRISHAAFDNGLIIETCGAYGQVLKILPPLTIPTEALSAGLDRLEQAIATVLASRDAATDQAPVPRATPATAPMELQ